MRSSEFSCPLLTESLWPAGWAPRLAGLAGCSFWGGTWSTELFYPEGGQRDAGPAGPRASTLSAEQLLGVGWVQCGERSGCGVDIQREASGLMQPQRVGHTILPFLVKVGAEDAAEPRTTRFLWRG